jgi:hypothetical protein
VQAATPGVNECHINFFFVPAPKYFYMFLPSIRLVNDLRLRQGGGVVLTNNLMTIPKVWVAKLKR